PAVLVKDPTLEPQWAFLILINHVRPADGASICDTWDDVDFRPGQRATGGQNGRRARARARVDDAADMVYGAGANGDTRCLGGDHAGAVFCTPSENDAAEVAVTWRRHHPGCDFSALHPLRSLRVPDSAYARIEHRILAGPRRGMFPVQRGRTRSRV